MFGKMDSGSVSYLCSKICEEFIELMREKTKQAITVFLFNSQLDPRFILCSGTLSKM